MACKVMEDNNYYDGKIKCDDSKSKTLATTITPTLERNEQVENKDDEEIEFIIQEEEEEEEDEEEANLADEEGKYCPIQGHRDGIRLLAHAQMGLAALSILISSFLLACSSCGTKGDSAGSGVWCPIFFLLLGAMCYNTEGKIHSSKLICIFGFTAAYFAVLMFAIETLEVTYSLQKTPHNVVGIALHIILCIVAGLELLLIISTICLHTRSNKIIKQTYKSLMTSADDYILPRILNTKTKTTEKV